jgi:hypothetical protein
MVFNKLPVIEAVLDSLRSEFETYVTTSKNARVTGNDAQTKSEGKYDTRSTEENYLADGLAKHALVARQAFEAISATPASDFPPGASISLGALIELELASENAWFFLAPAAGGLEVEVAGRTVTVLTPDSPLGLQLKGRRAGESTMQPASKILQVL